MGDERRATVFAEFIARNFPAARFPRVADVAGGMGYLSVELRARGYVATVVDPRPSAPCRRDRKALRRAGVGLPPRLKRGIEDCRLDEFDLLVGMHPDQATEPLAKLAAQKPVAVVPCCNYWQGLENHGAESVADCVKRTWKQLGVRWRETLLPMNGKNLVLWTEETAGTGGDHVTHTLSLPAEDARPIYLHRYPALPLGAYLGDHGHRGLGHARGGAGGVPSVWGSV